MIRLLDTHLLLWSTTQPERLSKAAASAITDAATVMFSAVSIWEIAIKQALRKPGFDVDPTDFRAELLGFGYAELTVSGLHAIEVANLPSLHGDPFDRLLIAQAVVEGFELVTADGDIARYPGPILKV